MGLWLFAVVFSSFFCLRNYFVLRGEYSCDFVGLLFCRIFICYSPAGKALQGKTVAEGTVFPYTNRPGPVNNKFIFSVFFFFVCLFFFFSF